MKVFRKNIIYLLGMVWVLLFSAGASWGGLLPEGVVMQETFQPGHGYAVGAVQLVQGEVVIVHEGELHGYWAQSDFPLFKGDMIVTLEKGRIRFKLNDESLITLASNTKLEITQSVYEPQNKVRSSLINMVLGKARFWASKLLDFRRSQFKVKSLTAVIGVRGSEWVEEVSLTATRITTGPDTTLEVVPAAAPEALPTVLEDFQATTIEEGRLPSEVESIAPEVYEQLQTPFAMPAEKEAEVSVRPQLKAKKEVKEEEKKADSEKVPGEQSQEVLVSKQELVNPEAIEGPAVVEETLTPEIIQQQEIAEQAQAVTETQSAVAEQLLEQSGGQVTINW